MRVLKRWWLFDVGVAAAVDVVVSAVAVVASAVVIVLGAVVFVATAAVVNHSILTSKIVRQSPNRRRRKKCASILMCNPFSPKG